MGISLKKPLRFTCDNVCENCLIRFKCWTQRGIIHLDWDDFRKIAEESEACREEYDEDDI